MFTVIVLRFVAISSSPVSSQNLFYSLPRDQSRAVTPHLGHDVYLLIPIN